MKQWSILGLGGCGMLLAFYFVPLFAPRPGQDICAFREVDNPQYLTFLRESKKRLGSDSQYIGWDGRKFSARLNRTFNELSKKVSTIDGRIAVMHAVLRSLGADYQDTIPPVEQGDPYARSLNEGLLTVGFSYLLDVNRLGMFSPLKRNAWIIAVIAGPKYDRQLGPLYPTTRGELTFIVHLPSLLENPHRSHQASGQLCPPLPPDQFAQAFSFSKD